MADDTDKEEQRAAAMALTRLMKAGAPDDLHPTERAFGAVMRGIKVLIATEVLQLETEKDRQVALAHIVGFLGEIVGTTCKALPEAVQPAAMTMFSRELNEAFGEPRCAIANLTTHPSLKENLH